MRVVKRDGSLEQVSFDKVLYRLQKLKNDKTLGVLENVDVDEISVKVITAIHESVKTTELDSLSATISIARSIENEDYAKLASRIVISSAHKNTSECFSDTMEKLFNNVNHLGDHCPLIADNIISIIRENKNVLNMAIDYTRDYLFDYFGYKTLERSYLLKIGDKVIERPQHLFMRVSLGIHGKDLQNVLLSYELMSQLYFTHASPTLFNAGTPRNQLASCNLLGIDDSISGFYKTLGDCALISKYAGGIGVHVSNVRSKGSYIKGTNGTSSGLVPLLKVFNETSRLANQGGKRNGSFAIYLEPWHADIHDFLNLKLNQGDPESRARDLFYALWVPDIFMKAVQEDSDWYLMDPNVCPGLTETHSSEFEELYFGYVDKGFYIEKIKARTLWDTILETQIETGMPYMLYKDSINRKSNFNEIIKSSNLCAEIVLPSSTTETAVCNLCSFSLPKFIEFNGDKPYFNHHKLYDIVKIATRNMNKVIDVSFYPTKETKASNERIRPIGIGCQGLADTFFLMRYPFESEEAAKLNQEIYETVQFAGWSASMEIASESGITFDAYTSTKISKGLFQHSLWKTPVSTEVKENVSGRWDWESLKHSILKYGVVNSTITAQMPTASTSQILGNYESIEPPTSNFFMRNVLSGEFPVINKYLIRDLIKLNLWNDTLRQRIMWNRGSIQTIPEIPENIKKLYKTIWEIPQKALINLSIGRAPYIDHSQSLNIYMESPSVSKLSSMHFYGWKNGLKTGLYYLKSKSATAAEPFTISKAIQNEESSKEEPVSLACSIERGSDCTACSG